MEEQNCSDLRVWLGLGLCAISHFHFDRLFADLQMFADLFASGAVLSELYPWHHPSFFAWFESTLTPGPEGREATFACFVTFCLSALPALYILVGIGGWLSQSRGGCGDIKVVLSLYAIGFVTVNPEIQSWLGSASGEQLNWVPEAFWMIWGVVKCIAMFIIAIIFCMIAIPFYVAGQCAALLSFLLSFVISPVLANLIVIYGFLGFFAFTIGLAGAEEDCC